MKYIVYNRYKAISNSGQINLPVFTECEEANNIIYYNGKQICFSTSEDAHQHFARNDDGQGLKRGELIQSIQKELRKQYKHQERWNKIWGAPSLLRYKRPEHVDHWLWNHAFFNAPIVDLEYILKLVKEV